MFLVIEMFQFRPMYLKGHVTSYRLFTDESYFYRHTLRYLADLLPHYQKTVRLEVTGRIAFWYVLGILSICTKH